MGNRGDLTTEQREQLKGLLPFRFSQGYPLPTKDSPANRRVLGWSSGQVKLLCISKAIRACQYILLQNLLHFYRFFKHGAVSRPIKRI